MKTPMQYQVSVFDCVPMCFINALAYLFHREEIPTTVIHHVHLYAYDVVGKRNELGWGTSAASVELVSFFLESYRTKKFQVETEFLLEEEVQLGRGNPLDACLEKGGVVLCRIRMGWFFHYALAISADKDRLYFFDPMLRQRIQGYKGRVEILESDGHEPNMSITRDWLDGKCRKKSRFCFGPVDERQALLVRRLT